MDYFTLLHLSKEPFSNSPDPEMFFQSTQHLGCLQKLELAIRLQQGLSVVIGDIGTGKSTLCRQLIQLIAQDHHILPHLILDPEFTSALEFLTTIAKTFGLSIAKEGSSEWQLKDSIKNYLFEQSIQHQKVPVLIVDEGQKLPGFCVEILREFLNFETNQHKLLQIVIFAQEEFQSILKEKPNFADRVTSYQRLRPLSLGDTRAMIDFRLKKSHREPGPAPRLFSPAAILAIYLLTKGYPRRIVMLCSKALFAILVKQKERAGVLQVLAAAQETAHSRPCSPRRILLMTAIVSSAVAIFLLPVAEIGTKLISAGLTPPSLPVAAPPVPPSVAPPNITAPVAPAPSPVVAPAGIVPPAPAAVPAPEAVDLPATPDLPLAPGLPQPEILGRVAVERGVSFSKMIARVYGRFSAKRMTAVLKANPQVSAPDRLEPKTQIAFPVLQRIEPRVSQDRVWLELSATTTLEAAYALVKDYPETAPPLLIKPTLSAEHGLEFHVILQETFADEIAALIRAKDLPAPWQEQVLVKR